VASLQMSRHYSDEVKLILNCNNPRGGKWKCEAEAEIYDPATVEIVCPKLPMSFNEGNRDQYCNNGQYIWWNLDSPTLDFDHNDKAVIEFRINIISSEGIEPTQDIDLSKFSPPIECNNVTLLIEGKKLRVSKDYLAIYSPVFHAMLFGNFAENGKGEVEMKDVVYEEFVDLLHFIFDQRRSVEITDCTVLHILKLADRFQLEAVAELSKTHLVESKGFDAATKLLLADQYSIVTLRDQVLQTFTNASGLFVQLKSRPDSSKISAEMKSAIYDHFLKI
ncbi:hypothetical protein PENTCL1PPCAC_7340, partial [Pristionchus entomophagus]